MSQIWTRQDDEIYHGSAVRNGGEHLSFSCLKLFMDSPATLKRSIGGENIKCPTDAMMKGTAFHKECLEQEKAYWEFRDEDYTSGGRIGTKSTTKAFKDSAKIRGIPIYNRKEMNTHIQMVKSFDAHDYVQSIMENAVCEVVIRHGETVSCQSKIDILNEEKNIIADIKTCQSLANFPKDIRNRKYDMQLGYYRRIYTHLTGNLPDCYLIAVEKDWPHQCALWRVEDYLLEANQLLIEVELQKFLNCREFNSWETGYEKPLDYPTEAFNYARGHPYGT